MVGFGMVRGEEVPDEEGRGEAEVSGRRVGHDGEEGGTGIQRQGSASPQLHQLLRCSA